MKRISILFAALLMSFHLSAGNKQSITINGITIDKVVKTISFEGDNVVLTYTDDSSDKEDMELVTLAFAYDGSSTGISQLTAAKGEKAQQVYTLDGVAMGKNLQGLRPGIYIVKGKKILIK